MLSQVSLPSVRVLTVETHRGVSVPLADVVTDAGELELLSFVQDKGYFTAHFRGRELRLTAGPYIGLIPLTPRLTIDVRPRLPTGNLARVIEIAQQPLLSYGAPNRLYPVHTEATPSVLEFLVRNLVDAIHEVETRGLYKIYEQHTENTSRPRGRIQFARTVAENISRSIRHKVVSTSFQQTPDNAYNRVLKYALWFSERRLSRLASRPHALMRDLNHALLLFEGVTLDPSAHLASEVAQALRRGELPSGRRYYERALKIALTIVAGEGVTLVGEGTDIELSSYVVNFDTVFEAYVRNILRTRISQAHSNWLVADGNQPEGEKPLFDDLDTPKANPDVVVTVDSFPRLIVEVKYKDKAERADINQAITYATSYRSPVALLIHPCPTDRASGKKHLGTINGIEILDYSFDLANRSLDHEEQAFADTVTHLTEAAIP